MAFTAFKNSKAGNVNFRVDISDFGKIDKFLAELTKAGRKAMYEELEEIANDIIKLAKQNVPVLTGALKSSGRVIKPRRSASATNFVYTAIFGGMIGKGTDPRTGRSVSKFVHYALKVETSHRSKANYLANAVAEIIPTMGSRVQRAVNSNINNVKGR